MYKITICCENNGEQLLSFKNKPIDTKKYPTIRRDIYKHLKPNRVTFLKNINILHKDFVEETDTEYRTVSIKKIEFVYDRELSEYQFKWFINYLKFVGFESCNNKNTIKFVENGYIVYNYKFDDAVSWDVNERDRVILTKKYKTQFVI